MDDRALGRCRPWEFTAAVMAGTRPALLEYDAMVGGYQTVNPSSRP